MVKLSFVIPCYRSEHTITEVVQEIKKTVAKRSAYDYEIILVNDSSPDNVYNVISELSTLDHKVKGLDLANNFGQHAALLTGLRYVTGDIVICLDDDGQTPPSEMFKLIEKLDEGFDVVFAKYEDKKHSLFRNLGSQVNDFMTRILLGKPKDLSIMSYFCCKRFVIDEIIKYNNPYPYMPGLLLRTTNKITNVLIPHFDRKDGSSGYTFKKLIRLWVNGFTAFSVKPLRISTLVGALFAFLGFLYGIYVIINKFLNPDAPLGYSSTMAMLVFIGGTILFMLGLVGEYIGRIYISINHSPQAVVRQSINIEDSENGNENEKK